MILLLRVWQSDDKQKSGNYVAGVFGRQQTKAAPAAKQQKQTAKPQDEEPPVDFDDDVPF